MPSNTPKTGAPFVRVDELTCPGYVKSGQTDKQAGLGGKAEPVDVVKAIIVDARGAMTALVACPKISPDKTCSAFHDYDYASRGFKPSPCLHLRIGTSQ